MGEGVLRVLGWLGLPWTAMLWLLAPVSPPAALWAAANPEPVAVGSALGAESLMGMPVTALAIRSDVPLRDRQEVLALVPITVGEPLTRDRLRRGLRNLQASGIASEIEMRAEPVVSDFGRGVAVTVVLWADVQVVRVEITGKLGLKPEALRKELLVRQGEPLLEGRVLRSLYRLQDLLNAQGYLDASVRLDVATDPVRKEASVEFQVDCGVRATIASVTVEGALRSFSVAQLLAQLDSKKGGPYLAARAHDDAERLRVFLVRQGYRLARVSPPRRQVASDQVNLVFPVELGPLFEVKVEGADFEKLRKRGLLPFLVDEGYDEALMLQALDAIRRDLQEQGHAYAKVEKREQRTADRWLITLMVTPGPQYTLSDVSFVGNQNVAAATLAGLMSTAPRRLLRPGSGRLVDTLWRDDLANLRSFYALQGYAEARIGPEQVIERGRELAVVVPVLEGTQSLVETLDIEGLEHVDNAWLQARLPLYPGGPFHALLLEDAVNLVRSELLDRGFERVQVLPQLTWNAERTRVRVMLDVYEGRQSVVDRVIVRGNVATRDDVVRRFVAVRPGFQVARKDLLEVQRELYRLGIFSRVEVSLLRAGEDSADRDVLVRLEEGRARRLLYGVGYDSEDGASGLAGFSHANLLGRALSVQIDLRASQNQRQARALFRQPFLGRWPVPVTYTLYRTDESQPSFDSRRRGVQVEAERLFGNDHRSRVGLLYAYKIVDLDLLDAAARVDRSLTNIRISSLTPNLLVDRRDDPVNPTRGQSLSVQLEVASPLLLADEAFLKFFVQGTHQKPLGRAVLASSLRLGAIEPFSDDAPADPSLPGRLPTAEVPISERFFAGGRTSHRAYERDFLGIRGATLCPIGEPCAADSVDADYLPVGGNGLALLNIDLRFPIGAGLGGTVFVDAGNVWPRWQDIDPSAWKVGAGLGLRYVTPIGPLRAEIGWKLDRERGESPYEVFLSFGNPF